MLMVPITMSYAGEDTGGGDMVSPRTTESKGVLKGMCRMLSVDGVCTLQGRGELHPLPHVNGVVSTLK